MECKIVAGQEVVCIYPGPWYSLMGDVNLIEHPQCGFVYHVEGVFPSEIDRRIYLRLAEFPNSYEASCFRRVQKTDISWAHEILREVKTRELVCDAE